MKQDLISACVWSALFCFFSSTAFSASTVGTVATKSTTTTTTTTSSKTVMPSPVMKMVQPVNSVENWKGQTQTSNLEFGLLGGANLSGTSLNWGLLATGAYLLDAQGWADDVDDRIWGEVELGPSFFSVGGKTSTGMQYSVHLRWDFTLNEYWTFYGLGGLGGFILPDSMGGSFTIHPRFGAGVEYQTKTALMFRGEISHEFLGVGVAVNF